MVMIRVPFATENDVYDDKSDKDIVDLVMTRNRMLDDLNRMPEHAKTSQGIKARAELEQQLEVM